MSRKPQGKKTGESNLPGNDIDEIDETD